MAKQNKTGSVTQTRRETGGAASVRQLNEAEIIASLPAARARAQKALATEPRAVAAYDDAHTGRIVVELANGMSFSFHPQQVNAALARATPAQLARVELFPSGAALRWDSLDIDLSVTGILERLLGDHVRVIAARLAGRTRSAKKARSARENGKLGGRPLGRVKRAESGKHSAG